MTNRELARIALKGAYRLRKLRKRTKDEPVSPFDIAVESNLHLQFVDAPSLEGMYCDEKQAIIISCLRPIGRRAYTCGHELGHWFFGHGTSADELPEDDAARQAIENSPEERLANAFSSFLLMPPLGVESAIKSRGWNFKTLEAVQVYILSTYFGVGYTTMLGHLRYSIDRISQPQYELLRKRSPKSIRAELSDGGNFPHLVVVDSQWGNRPVDLEVGDAVSIHSSSRLDGIKLDDGGPGALTGHRIAVAKSHGQGMLTSRVDHSFLQLRVSERNWVGIAENRFEH